MIKIHRVMINHDESRSVRLCAHLYDCFYDVLVNGRWTQIHRDDLEFLPEKEVANGNS
jgi:hypothetical protein